MINFDFKKYQDVNGFVRLKDVQGFDKFINTWKKMTIYTSTNPHSALYKDYSKTTYSFENDGVPVAFSKNGNLVGNTYSDDLEIVNI